MSDKNKGKDAGKNGPEIVKEADKLPGQTPGQTAADMAEAMAMVIRNADEFDASGMSFEQFVSLGEKQGIGGRFLGVGATIITGFPDKDGRTQPTRLPTIAVLCEIHDPETGEFRGSVVAKMIASSNVYSQAARLTVGDDVTIVRMEGTAKTRSNFNVKRFAIGSKPNKSALPVIPDGFYPFPVAQAALAEMPAPTSLADHPLPPEVVARVIGKLASKNQPALPAAPAANALPANASASSDGTTPATAPATH